MCDSLQKAEGRRLLPAEGPEAACTVGAWRGGPPAEGPGRDGREGKGMGKRHGSGGNINLGGDI